MRSRASKSAQYISVGDAPVLVRFVPRVADPDEMGHFDEENDEITILNTLTPGEQLEALFHEIAHAVAYYTATPEPAHDYLTNVARVCAEAIMNKRQQGTWPRSTDAGPARTW